VDKEPQSMAFHWRQAILIGSTILASWLGMQACHELGHIGGAWLTGGRVARVVLHPLTISRTDLVGNPSPLAVVWAGPVVGIAVPLVLWLATATMKLPGAFVLRFFAGFCLLANGLYLGIGSLDRVGDCREMLVHGSQLWQLWLFGAVTAPIGLCLWHRQGVHFGLAPANGQVHGGVAYGTLVVFVLLIALAFAIGGE
jgi:hypothetical protein